MTAIDRARIIAEQIVNMVLKYERDSLLAEADMQPYCIDVATYAITDHTAQALIDAQAEIERLRKALGYFLADERFQVAVGGNPIAVEKMLAEARAALQETDTP